MASLTRALTLATIIAISTATCPFSRQSRRAVDSTDPAMKRAMNLASKGEFCGAPLCDPSSTSRRLLSTEGMTMMSNGFPRLTQATVNQIEASFCELVDGTLSNTRNACSVTTGLTGGGESANEDRSDITAGAIQLAFHDAGTWDPSNITHPGGADGCACDKFGPNAGLDYIKDVLAPVYTSYKSYLSLADFWAICANAAIKSSVGEDDAPLTVGFKYGRSDVDCADCDYDIAARLPDESKSTDHVEDVFVTRMGFTKKETVALMGAHSMGKMEPLNTGYAGKWDRTFAQLDNIYFEQILDRPWFRFDVDETTKFNGQAPYPTYVHEKTKHEWRVADAPAADDFQDDTNKLLNTDMCLAWAIGDGDDVNDETCSTRACDEDACEANDRADKCATQVTAWRSHVVNYAANNALFLTDFASAWQKLVELTPNTLVGVGATQSAASGSLAYFCKHESDASSYYANCNICVDNPICCDADDAASSTATDSGGSRCTESAYGVTNTQACVDADVSYPSKCSATLMMNQDDEDIWEEVVKPL